ncbi:MAG: acetylglutamate kinase, partial [Bacteroidetes bacterium]|nr:acetylglutamate kinase [Bacteroidota bacterium]
KMNIPVQVIDGRRITDAETLKVATMVYAGYINKNIVALLQQNQCNALGLSGADGNSILSSKRNHPSIDYGFVGDIEQVNATLYANLLQMQLCPVVSAITHDGQGQLLNTNADTIASSIAVAMSQLYKVKLIYCFEKSGVLTDVNDEQSVIPKLDAVYYNQLKAEQKIHSGMLPKLDNAFSALNSGVSSVVIGHAIDLLSLMEDDSKTGTHLS